MLNKKTVKRNKRNSKRSRSRSRKGGFFGLFDDKHNTGNTACDPNNLANLKDSNSMHANYQTCCPKNWYGSKNNSPYCKQLDLNYKAASQKNQMEIASTKQMINTKTFNVNDNIVIQGVKSKTITLDNAITFTDTTSYAKINHKNHGINFNTTNTMNIEINNFV